MPERRRERDRHRDGVGLWRMMRVMCVAVAHRKSPFACTCLGDRGRISVRPIDSSTVGRGSFP
jgi:hypothetical protein